MELRADSLHAAQLKQKLNSQLVVPTKETTKSTPTPPKKTILPPSDVQKDSIANPKKQSQSIDKVEHSVPTSAPINVDTMRIYADTTQAAKPIQKTKDSTLFTNFQQPLLDTITGNQCIFRAQDSTKMSTTRAEVGNEGLKIPTSIVHQDSIFGLLLVCFLLFSYFYRGRTSLFKENARFVFSSHKTPNLFDETTVSDFWYNFIFIFQTILLASTMLFSYLCKNESNFQTNYLLIIASFILCIYIFIAFRYSLQRYIGYIFDINDTIKNAIRSDIALTEMTGAIAFLPSLILLSGDKYDNTLFLFLIILFVVSRLIYIYRTIIHFLEEKLNFLFLITYLCTVEIIPYVFLYKGLTFLYEHNITNIL